MNVLSSVAFKSDKTKRKRDLYMKDMGESADATKVPERLPITLFESVVRNDSAHSEITDDKTSILSDKRSVLVSREFP